MAFEEILTKTVNKYNQFLTEIKKGELSPNDILELRKQIDDIHEPLKPINNTWRERDDLNWGLWGLNRHDVDNDLHIAMFRLLYPDGATLFYENLPDEAKKNYRKEEYFGENKDKLMDVHYNYRERSFAQAGNLVKRVSLVPFRLHPQKYDGKIWHSVDGLPRDFAVNVSEYGTLHGSLLESKIKFTLKDKTLTSLKFSVFMTEEEAYIVSFRIPVSDLGKGYINTLMKHCNYDGFEKLYSKS